jgi:hypothetical protein
MRSPKYSKTEVYVLQFKLYEKDYKVLEQKKTNKLTKFLQLN